MTSSHRKREVYLRGLAHFVEIDLFRRGRCMPMLGRWPDSPYYLLVCRKPEAPRAPSGRPIFVARCRPFPFPWQRPTRT